MEIVIGIIVMVVSLVASQMLFDKKHEDETLLGSDFLMGLFKFLLFGFITFGTLWILAQMVS